LGDESVQDEQYMDQITEFNKILWSTSDTGRSRFMNYMTHLVTAANEATKAAMSIGELATTDNHKHYYLILDTIMAHCITQNAPFYSTIGSTNLCYTICSNPATMGAVNILTKNGVTIPPRTSAAIAVIMSTDMESESQMSAHLAYLDSLLGNSSTCNLFNLNKYRCNDKEYDNQYKLGYSDPAFPNQPATGIDFIENTDIKCIMNEFIDAFYPDINSSRLATYQLQSTQILLGLSAYLPTPSTTIISIYQMMQLMKMDPNAKFVYDEDDDEDELKLALKLAIDDLGLDSTTISRIKTELIARGAIDQSNPCTRFMSFVESLV
jgi:hypothetical protein